MAESRNPKYIAVLALAAGLILVVGNLIRPRETGAEGAPALAPQAERAVLDRLTQRASLENQTAYFSRIAYDAALQLVRLPAQKATGIVWAPGGVIVTTNTDEPFPQWVEPEGGRSRSIPLRARTAAAPPDLPIAILRSTPETTLPPAVRQPLVVPYVGEWIVAVWRTNDLDYVFSIGQFQGTARRLCRGYAFDEMLSNVPLTPVMAGGGLFDQDGRLFAVIVPCEGRYVSVSVESVSSAIEEANSQRGLMLTRYGMSTAALEADSREHFGAEEGALIQEVWLGYPAAAADLRPGDLIVSLDGEAVRSPEDLHVLIMPLARETFEVGIRRGRRITKTSLQARPSASAPADNAPLGLKLQGEPPGYAIDSVLPGSPADKAGIQAGDRVIRIGQLAPRNSAEVRRALAGRSGGSHFLVLQRGNRRWGVLLS